MDSADTVAVLFEWNIWTRPTIPWTLECENDHHTRKEALDKFTLHLVKDNSLSITVIQVFDLGMFCTVWFVVLGYFVSCLCCLIAFIPKKVN